MAGPEIIPQTTTIKPSEDNVQESIPLAMFGYEDLVGPAKIDQNMLAGGVNPDKGSPLHYGTDSSDFSDAVLASRDAQVKARIAEEGDPQKLYDWELAKALAGYYRISAEEIYGDLPKYNEQFFGPGSIYKGPLKAIVDVGVAMIKSMQQGKIEAELNGWDLAGALGQKLPQWRVDQLEAKSRKLSEEISTLSLDLTPRDWDVTFAKMLAGAIPYTAKAVFEGAVAGVVASTGLGALGVGAEAAMKMKSWIISINGFVKGTQMIGGMNYRKMVDSGIDKEVAKSLAIPNAAVQSAIEAVGFTGAMTKGAASGLWKKAAEKIVVKLGITNIMASTAGALTMGTITDMVSNGFEEGSQRLSDDVTMMIAQSLTEDGLITEPVLAIQMGKNILEDFVGGALVAPFMRIPGMFMETMARRKQAVNLAAVATVQTKEDFRSTASESGFFDGFGVSDEDKLKLSDTMWHRQIDLQIDAQGTAADVTKAKAKKGQVPGEDIDVNRMPGGELLMQEKSLSDTKEGNPQISYLVGDPTDPTNIYGEVNIIESGNQIIISGGTIEESGVAITSEILTDIAAKHPGMELVLGEGVEVDSALAGGYEAFVEANGTTMFDRNMSEADIAEERRQLKSAEDSGLEASTGRVYVAALKAVAYAAKVPFSELSKTVDVTSTADRLGITGTYSAAKNLSKAVVRIARDYHGDFQSEAAIHEVTHHFRAFMSRYAPNDESLKAVEKELGIQNGIWDQASDESFARMVRDYLTTRKVSNLETKNFLDRVSEFLLAIYNAVKDTTTPEVRAALDKWFDGFQGAGGLQATDLKASNENIGSLGTREHPFVKSAETMKKMAEQYIDKAMKKFGKTREYYDETVRMYARAAVLYREYLKKQSSTAISEYQIGVIDSGSWFTDPQLVAELKEFSGDELLQEEKDLLTLARGEMYTDEGLEDPNILHSVVDLVIDDVYGKKAIEAFNFALKDVGTTTDPSEAGFVLPDGKMLNFSGGNKGSRGLMHEAIDYPNAPKNSSNKIDTFINYGAVRVDLGSGIVEMGMAPTSEQWEAILAGIESSPSGFAHVDMRDKGRYGHVMVQVDNKRSIGMVARFYSGQDISGENVSQLFNSIDEEESLEHTKADRTFETEAKKYGTFEGWLDSMYGNKDTLSEADRSYYKARYDYAHSPQALNKRFPKPGDFIKHLREGSNLSNLAYRIGKAIYSRDRFVTDEADAHATRIEGAIAKTPELKKLVDVAYKGEAISRNAKDKFFALAGKHEALFKYLQSLVDSDEDLAHEALDDMTGVPELIKRDMTGSENVSIADQAQILDALKGSELEDKLASGTITMAEVKEYIASEEAKNKETMDAYKEDLKARAKEKIKGVKAEEREKSKAKMAAYKAKLKARTAAKRLQREMQRVIDSIFRAPSARVAYFHASMIRAIQEALASHKPVDRKSLESNGSFSAMYDKAWNEHFNAFLALLNMVVDKDTDNIPLDVAQEIASYLDTLAGEGRRQLRDMEVSWGETTKYIRSGISTELMSGKFWKPSVMKGSEEDKARVRQLDKMAKWFDKDRPDAFFRKFLGKTATQLLFDESMKARSSKLDNYDRRTRPVTEYLATPGLMKDLNRKLTLAGVWNDDNGRVVPMTITGSELVGMRMIFGTRTEFNKYQREALVYGNTFSAIQKNADGTLPAVNKKANSLMRSLYDAKVELINQFIETSITPQEEHLAKLMMATMNNEQDWFRFAQTMIYLTNKEPKKEDFYFSLIRIGSFADGEDDTLDELKGYGMRTGLDSSMAISRNQIQPRNQKPIKYDALQVYFNAVSKQEHLTEVGPYIKRLRGVFLSSTFSETLRPAIEQSLGRKALDYIDDQIDTLTNPSEFKEKASGAEALTFWRGAMVVSNLAWRWSSVLMQVLTSPLPGYAEAPLQMLPASIRCYTNPIKFVKDVESKSPFLRHRQLTPEVKYMRLRKQLGLSTTLENISIMGMTPLTWADRVSVAIVWDAVRQKNVDKGMSEGLAIDEADKFTVQTQPTSEEADRAPMYRDPNEFKQLILQFTQPLSVIWNNIRNDIPQAAKEQEYGKIVGFITAYAMSGLAIGWVAVLRGRGPEDPDDEKWMRYWIHASTSQFTDSIPFIGQVVTSLTGYAIVGDNNSWLRTDKNMPALDFLARGVEALLRKSGPDYGKFLINAARGVGMMNMVPVRAIEEYCKMISQAFGGE